MREGMGEDRWGLRRRWAAGQVGCQATGRREWPGVWAGGWGTGGEWAPLQAG